MNNSYNKFGLQKILFGVVVLGCVGVTYYATNRIQQTGFPYISTTAQSQLLAPKLSTSTENFSDNQGQINGKSQIEIVGECVEGKGFFVFVNQLQENIYPEYCKSTSNYVYKIDPTKNLIEGNNYIQVQYDTVESPDSLMSESLLVKLNSQLSSQSSVTASSQRSNSNASVNVSSDYKSSLTNSVLSSSPNIAISSNSSITSSKTISTSSYSSSTSSSTNFVSNNYVSKLISSSAASINSTYNNSISSKSTNSNSSEDIYKVKNISYSPNSETPKIEIASTINSTEIKNNTATPSILLPNQGDGNNDKIKDIEQENIYTLETPSKDSFVTAQFDSSDPNCRIPVSISTTSQYAKGDKDFDYPFGHLQFKLKCPSTTTVKIFWHGIKYEERDNYKFRKFSNIIPSSGSSNDYFDFVPTLESIKIENKNVLVTKYTITDGQYGDSTPKDGYIIDPIGAVKIQNKSLAFDTLTRTGGFVKDKINIGIIGLVLMAILFCINQWKRPNSTTQKS
jgi:hypothetical protein